MCGTTDVGGILSTLPYAQFAAWHAYFEYERREQEKLTLPQLAMTYNTSLLMAAASSGTKLDTSLLKTPDDFLAGSRKGRKRRDPNRLDPKESERRARSRFGS